MESTILSSRELRRYEKQMMLPGIGREGQERLKKAKVLVVGAGGLGCSVLQFLSTAGTGKIGIAEFDTVDEANLQRQVLFGTNDLGKLKSVIAKSRLEYLNSFIDFEIFNLKIGTTNARKISGQFDVIVDATDNLESRYIINDTCVILEKPMVHGSIYRNEGQVSVFNYKGGPTYRCFNPQKKDKKHLNPSPADVGILGVLAGITGTMMANEVIKIITGTGHILCGKILVFNIMSNSYRTFNIENIPENHEIKDIDTQFL
jgi:sulfur-carrier protein adenylyltransferase/sulfurtransferase